ncbi:hypothetical protein EJB05_25775, partial [Eragrostis curvula]
MPGCGEEPSCRARAGEIGPRHLTAMAATGELQARHGMVAQQRPSSSTAVETEHRLALLPSNLSPKGSFSSVPLQRAAAVSIECVMVEETRRKTFLWQRPGQSRNAPASPPPLTAGRVMDRPPSDPSPLPDPSWVLLDRFVHYSRRRRGVYRRRPHDLSHVRRLHRPPLTNVMDPTAVAAHRHAVLFRLTVPVEDPAWWHVHCCFPVDYFVYSASLQNVMFYFVRLFESTF